jgi:Copper amine oxidase N-terminal domain
MRLSVAENPSLLPSRGSVVATAVLAAIASLLFAASQPASLRIDGQRVASDVPPVTSLKGEAFVPLRVVAEALGAEMDYDTKTGTIELLRNSDTLRLRAGDNIATFNGKKILLKHAPFSVRGRTMVSQAVIERAFGSTVKYDGQHAKIDVLTPGVVEAGAQEDSP